MWAVLLLQSLGILIICPVPRINASNQSEVGTFGGVISDNWNLVVRDMFITADVESSFLRLKTGPGSKTTIYFYNEEDKTAGGFVVKFYTSSAKYKLRYCQDNYMPLLLPAQSDKQWRIEKRGFRFKVFCNGQLVLDKTTSNVTCDDPGRKDTWSNYWGREVRKIKFPSKSDFSSTHYFIEHRWKFEKAALTRLENGTMMKNNNEGLLFVTVKSKDTGAEREGTVCADEFNWYSAQRFCWSMGHLFAEWGSYKKNINYIPEYWLNKTSVPIVMDDVSCRERDTEVSMCSARILQHNCQYKDNIWLRCFNETGCIDKSWTNSGKKCTITIIGGFFKHLCFNEIEKKYYHMCVSSEVSYEQNAAFDIGTGSYTLSKVSSVCENDPNGYQACGFSTKVTKNSSYLCGGYFTVSSSSSASSDPGGGRFVDCEKTEDGFCEKTSVSLPSNNTCNDRCDDLARWCMDEGKCNGFQYGIHTCSVFIPNTYICTGSVSSQCSHNDDEIGCEVDDNTPHTCVQYYMKLYWGVERQVPIFNNTRCGVFDFRSLDTYPYCENFLDQTNCSDVTRIGGHCRINNYRSSVSKFVLCDSPLVAERTPVNLCDDNLESECSSPSGSCTVHKHRLCDGVADCSDKSDEENDFCSRTTQNGFKCYRTFNADANMEIPISWIMDRQYDCIDGEDEQGDLWDFCGKDNTKRVKPGDGNCQDVFLCPGDLERQYVEFHLLCDGVNSCGPEFENDVCTVSRDFPSLDTAAEAGNCSTRDLCQSVEILENVTCHIREFTGPLGDVFGVRMRLNVPTIKVNCSLLYGEYYVFLSCMDLCLDSSCPLENTDPPHYDSCPGQYPDRVYTLANNSFLTFVTGSEGEYESTYFQCENNRCVRYSQVCDLIDDCGDMSDERYCTNHMVCEDTINKTNVKQQLISYSQKCDGRYDCFDLSDECNESCEKEILDNWVLKLSSWLLGPISAIFNIIIVIKVAISLKESRSGSQLVTRVLVCLIGFGDFLIGVYLTALSVFDSIVQGKAYCRNQAEWLSGTACSILGVLSTTGSQLSLFSMTVLSVIRVWGIVGTSLALPTPVDKRAVVKAISIAIVMVVASLTVAVTPLVSALEDYFVQGKFYDSGYKVFIGFPNKVKHIRVLQEYLKNETISSSATWSEIGNKVNTMFSQNHGSLRSYPVHFYGNDGVCMFKYFVRSDDPTRSRDSPASGEAIIDTKGNSIVWTMLGVNLFCFVLITLSYFIINIRTSQSSENSGQNNNPEAVRKNQAMQRRIAAIIATDFVCWVPFIIISALHNWRLIDATFWYVTFAMIVLPLNSVINPLLYDNTLRDFINGGFRFGATTISRGTGYFSRTSAQTQPTTVEMDVRKVQCSIYRNGVALSEDITDMETDA